MPKCEILIREKNGSSFYDTETVAMWKRFDGDPKHMLDWFKEFADWVQDVANTEPETVLKDANIMASLLVVYDTVWTEAFYEQHPKDKPNALIPDVRPMGGIEDAEYLYIVDLPLRSDTENGNWFIRVRGWHISEHNRRYIDIIEDGKAPPQSAMKCEKLYVLKKTQEIVDKMQKLKPKASKVADEIRKRLDGIGDDGDDDDDGDYDDDDGFDDDDEAMKNRKAIDRINAKRANMGIPEIDASELV